MSSYGGPAMSPYEQQPSSPQGGNAHPATGKIFIGGLSPSVTSESLISHFSAYGEVIDATIMNDKITGRPRGFGFVTFRNPEAVDALMQEQHVLDGKQVECKRAVPMGYLDKPQGGMPMGGPSGRPVVGGGMAPQYGAPAGQGMSASGNPPRYNPEKIFVGGLPISCDDNKLREYFSKYGVIVDAVVMIDRDLQRHRGFGYVLFQDAGSVDAAVNEHDNHQIDGKWIDVKRCVVQENAAMGGGGGNWPQSGPMRKGFGKGGFQAPMPGLSATMPGYYGAGSSVAAGRPASGGYGGADYGTSQYYGMPAAKGPMPMYGAPRQMGRSDMPGAGQPAAGGYGMAGGYMASAYGAQQPTYGYGVAPADPYASSGYGQAAPSPYGSMPGYGSMPSNTGYAAGYGASAGYGQASAYGAGYGQMPGAAQPPTSAGAANPNDLYNATRRTGYRTSPY